jgi:SAM-dependent methyltransferase
MERLSQSEMSALFDNEKDQVRIKQWIAQGIRWHVGDAADESMSERFEPADIVVASNFLCHMAPADAQNCLRNLVHFVKPGGHIFVSGVDLDIRTAVATDLGWAPVPALVEEIHNGDPCMLNDWPWKYWGLEPFDLRKPNWHMRYAAFFRIGSGQEIPEPVSVEE